MENVKILVYGNKQLRKKSEKIKKVTKKIHAIIDKMWQAVTIEKGVGLAAPQIGILKQIILIDLTSTKENIKMVLLNPVIKKKSKEIVEMEEGCLSVPKIYANVKRPTKISVEYMDLKGKTQKINADDFLARVIQHEVDHLNGVLFVDRLDEKELNKIKPELEKLRFENEI